MCLHVLDDRGSNPPIVSINGEVLLAVTRYVTDLRDAVLRQRDGLLSPARTLAASDPVVSGPGAADAWGSQIDLVRPGLPRPSGDELAGLRQIRTGDVSSVRQAELADRWIDRLSAAMESAPVDDSPVSAPSTSPDLEVGATVGSASRSTTR